MKFKISEKEGLKYSNISGDKNKIHIDYLTGYNSIYGEKICHGTLVVSKIFKNKEFKKLILSEKPFNIRIEFLEFIKYDEIFVLKKINNKFHIIQNNKVKIHISIQKRNNYYFNKKNKKKVRYFKKKLISFKNKYDLIFSLLANISSFVGNKYPGKYSLLRSINLNFNNNYLLNEKKIIINSYKLDKRFPLIENVLQYEKFIIEFESLERPIVQKNKFYIKNDLKQKIKTLKDNVLIIGGSSGIGNDIFNLFKVNKDILKIVTFNKNKISLKIANSLFFKIDILRDLNKIKFIINKYGPVQIFYFPTTKISFDKKVNNEKLKEYKKIFLNIPLKIIKNSKKKNYKCFLPINNIYL